MSKRTNPTWSKLRIWKTSQEDAFEELCCQLAHAEPVPTNATFIRNGTPDAGVECLWILPNGQEWGWQAKFPSTGLSKSLWSELEDSVKTAISKHPTLTRYFVCLPLSLSDARVKGQTSAREKWANHTQKWATLAKKGNREIDFILWDEHELWMRLAQDEHKGRRYFWFGETVIDSHWAKNNVQAAIAQAGDKYDAHLNIKVPESDLFPFLARTPELWAALNIWALELTKAFKKKLRALDADADSKELADLQNALSQCVDSINALKRSEDATLSFELVSNALTKAAIARNLLWRKRKELAQARIKVDDAQPKPKANIHRDLDWDMQWEILREITTRIDSAQEFLDHPSIKLVNNPVLLINGEAGSGKTHLLCTIAEKAVNADVPVIFLLGEQFNNADPWPQILSLLGVGCGRDEFLGALDAAAEASKCRAVILIDALNEGDGLKFWPRHISSFLSHIRRWPRLSLCISVRSGYEAAVLPNGFCDNSCITITHHGFSEIETEAATQFFNHFGIATPSVPILSPEFSNPLFLKLFCKALQNAGLKEVPTGLNGITAIFDFFLETINAKLAKPRQLDFDVTRRLVQKSVDRLATLMAESGHPHLPTDQVKMEIDSIFPSAGYENSLERRLRVEGVLSRRMDSTGESVHFTYQRFTDHRIVKVLLRDTKRKTVSQIFAQGSILFNFLNRAGWYWRTQGTWDALAIQLPELFNLELPDAIPTQAYSSEIRGAFLSSIVWRKRDTFSERTFVWIANYLEARETYSEVMNALLLVCTCGEHPFNARFLNSILEKQPMPERDVSWSIYLFREYGENGNLNRLIDWGSSENGHTHLDDETIYLGSITLAWFLTTSHRMVRDRATTALVSILTNRVQILRQLLQLFQNVNDPYVIERLYAVAHGCALRTEKTQELRALAQQVYDFVFKSGSPPVHILLRDYAKGVVQTAINRGLCFDFDLQSILPPYCSEWVGKLPSLDRLERAFHSNTSSDRDNGGRRLFRSVTNDDFAHYEMSDLTMWTKRQFGRKCKKSKLQIYEDFIAKIPPDLLPMMQNYEQGLWKQRAARRLLGFAKNDEYTKRSAVLAEFEREFELSLGKKLGRLFRIQIAPTLREYGRPLEDEHFNKEFLQQWILHRVLQLGWTREKFGEFDSLVSRSGRDAYKPERIGKKYQWIALHEFYARLGDNFEFAKNYRGPSEEDKASGKWTVGFRDIDASLLLRSTPKDGWSANHICWWIPIVYRDWFSKTTKLNWLKSVDDLPSPNQFLEVINPKDGSQWLVLEGFINWEYQESVGQLRTEEADSQQVWYMFKSYFSGIENFQKLLAWTSKQTWTGRWMPEAPHFSRVWLHEHYTKPHFSSCMNEEWIAERVPSRGGELPCPSPILISNHEYMREKGTHDCSIDQTVSINLPCRWLVEKMQLELRGRHGEYFSKDGSLIAFDPSVREHGPGALLINKRALLGFLKESKHDIFWTFLGEKNIYAPNFSGRDEWLGRLELSGTYYLKDDLVVGSFQNAFSEGGLSHDSDI